MATSDQISATIGRARPSLTASMLDECTIRRPSTVGELNEATGLHEVEAGELVYAGVCRLDATAGGADPTDRNDKTITATGYALLLPYDASGVRTGDVVAITSSDDPDYDAHTFRVVRVLTGTFRTHQEFALEEVSSDA